MKQFVWLTITLICLGPLISAADSDFAKAFKANYGLIDIDLSGSPGEKTEVKDFVYKKDVATFTFKEGTFYLLRPILGRPTTALFMGKGHVDIQIPSHVEQQSLQSISGDTAVSQDFEICFIRMADNLDQKLKAAYAFESVELKWKTFTQLKQEHAEQYFKPIVQHEYDNYFELLRSVYERTEDGYFWAYFNRYGFTYDPSVPEEISVTYEFQEGEFMPTLAARFEKMSDDLVADTMMSRISFPTTAIEKHGDIVMGGLDGSHIDNARSDVKVLINADSLRFLSIFLHFNLKIDSIYYSGKPVDYYHRKDFTFLGIMLPEYRHRGDTITLTFWYDGFNFDYLMPYVENPNPCPQTFTFTVPKGFNYLMPGMGPMQRAENGMVRFDVTPDAPYDKFYFQGYATGYDTVSAISTIGMTLNFIKSKNIDKRMDCFVPDDMYENTAMDAFNYLSGHIGSPAGTFVLYVFPDGSFSMPGLVEIPQILCYNQGSQSALGGYSVFPGYAMARQWFGSLLKPISYRDNWLKEATDGYLSLIFVQSSVGGGAYYSNLIIKRDSIRTLRELNRDRPLAVSGRSTENIRGPKGSWLFHMLRYLMFDLDTHDDSRFTKFLFELSMTCNGKAYSNADIIRLAEKHYGQPLDWFFKEWLYDYGYPEYTVDYTIAQEGTDYYINASVNTTGVRSYFHMPVIMRVAFENGESKFVRQDIAAEASTFRLGPYPNKPKELVFNELYSVLSKDNVSKR